MSSTPETESVPPGVVGTPQGAVVALTYPFTQDYPRLVFGYPRFEPIAIADIINPSVMEACQALLPSLVPPYVTQAANDAVNNLAVRRVGDTMTGALNLSPVIPTANAMAASKQYVDTQIGTVIPEVPPVPANQAWARETGQWVPLGAGGTVTNIATGAGLTGGPITATGTISMANMAANSLKGNNTGAVASPVDLNVGQVMNMLGAAPLNSPVFTGTPVLPTGTQAITQPGGTNNTTVATTAFAAAGDALRVLKTGDTMTGALTINLNPATGPAAPGAALHVTGVNSGQADVTLDAFSNIAALTLRASGGTAAVPTATQSGDYLSSLTTQGYTTGGAYAGGTAIVSQARETGPYSPTAQGSQLIFNTIPTGTVSAVASLVLAGGYATFAGGGGVGIGTAASAPGNGALTLNANTVAPAVALSPANLTMIGGAANANATLQFDTYGTGTTAIFSRTARGTASAPTTTQSGDLLGVWWTTGYGATGYGPTNTAGITLTAAQTWTDTAHGTQLALNSTPLNSTTTVNSLILQGNTATFSGTIVVPTNSNMYFNGTTGGTAARIVSDGNNILLSAASTGGGFAVQNSAVTLNLLLVDSIGDLTINGATATKPGSTSWVNPSAREIKQDIKPYTGSLGDLLDLTPVTYRYSDDSGFDASQTHVGLVHDETAHMPELHRTATLGIGDDAREVDALDCGALTFALINAVKELSARLTAVEGRA